MENKNTLKENLPLICMLGFVTFAIISLIVILKFTAVPPVAACLMLILEAVLAVLLVRAQFWVHGIVFIAQVIAGIIASQVLFMVLMGLAYGLAILFLYVRKIHE